MFAGSLTPLREPRAALEDVTALLCLSIFKDDGFLDCGWAAERVVPGRDDENADADNMICGRNDQDIAGIARLFSAGR